MFEWPVVPVCEAQKRDVRPDDLLEGGLYRKCSSYRGGGGYDRFPAIAQKRLGIPAEELVEQFVVQLYGCPLRCPYCYVTKSGVFGDPVRKTTEELVAAFRRSGLRVFHLMGGAPALYMDYWPELIKALPDNAVFTSDLMLVEKLYGTDIAPTRLDEIAEFDNVLLAVSIKGGDSVEFKARTGVPLDEELFKWNVDAIAGTLNRRQKYYVTFTGMSDESICRFKKQWPLLDYTDSFAIPIRHYKALDSGNSLYGPLLKRGFRH